MEENERISFNENKHYSKIESTKNRKITITHILKRKYGNANKNAKINISFIIICLFVVIIIFLIVRYKRLNNKFKYEQRNSLENYLKNIKNYTKNNIVKNLFGYKIEEYENNNFSQIHISYSLDNNIIYPTLISMLSGLENNNNNLTIIVYHLLLSHDFNTSNIYIFESLKINYYVKINYYIIPHIFTNLRKWTDKTGCIYNKILLPIILPNLERIISLDGDTLIRKDISEMYNYPFNDNYILGAPFYYTHVMDKFGIKAEHYINAGCLLFNIKKIIKDHKEFDLMQFTVNKNKKLHFPEQDSINYIFYPNVGFLPLKYGIYMIGSKRTFKLLSRYTRSPLNLTEGYEAVADPSVVHFACCWPKVWTNGTKNLFKENEICRRYQKEFYYYANKSLYYTDIYNTLFFQKIKKKKKKKKSSK